MKIRKDSKLDVAYIELRKGKVAETVEFRPGMLIDLDRNGEILGIEVLSLKKLAPLIDRQVKKRPGRSSSISKR